MTTVSILHCIEDAELFRQYHGQHEPQPCFIALDLPSGRLWADYNPHIGGGVEFDVVHGFERHWGIPLLTAGAANELLDQIAPLAQKMLEHWEKDWNGNNMVAVLGDAAAEAEEQISGLLGGQYDDHDPRHPLADAARVQVWGLDTGALNGQETEEFDITGDTTDERLDEIAQEIRDGLADCGANPEAVVIVPGLVEHLRGLRDDQRAGAEL